MGVMMGLFKRSECKISKLPMMNDEVRKKPRTAQSLRAKPIRSTNKWFHSGCRKSTVAADPRAIGDSGSHGQREDRAGQFRFPAQAVKIAIASTMG
jgi:hypothetical protein